MLSIIEKISFFEEFVRRNSAQIRSKARFFRVEQGEIESSLFILVAERLDKFDATKGSAEAFFFGRLHARFAAYASDVCSRAKSIDDGSETGVAFRTQVEYWISSQQNETCFTNKNGTRTAAGAADLISLADSASGKSAAQIADELGITRRRVNQILKKARDASSHQFGLPFEGGEK